MAAQAAHERPLVSVNAKKYSKGLNGFCGLYEAQWSPQIKVPVDGFDVHLQAVSTGRAMATLLTHKRLFSPMFRRFVHAQLRASQEGFRTLGTLKRETSEQTCMSFTGRRCPDPLTHRMWFGVTVSLHHVKSQTFLAHKLFRTNGALEKEMIRRSSINSCEVMLEAWSGSLRPVECL